MLRQALTRHNPRSRSLLKNFLLLRQEKEYQPQQRRDFTPEPLLEYKPGSADHAALKKALKDFSAHLTTVPIFIGELRYHTGDVQHQRMPHNWRNSAAQMSWANQQIVNWAIRVAGETQCEWNEVPLQERIEMWCKCADILSRESRHKLNAAIMLGQGKTIRQAEEDTCRTINDLRFFAAIMLKIQQRVKARKADKFGYIMRPSGGFVAAITPYNWTSMSTNLAFCPALMGNCVLWMPSPYSILSCYEVYLAMRQAEMPDGVISFMPSNANYCVNNVSRSTGLAGINYAGRMKSYQAVAKSVAEHMERHSCFSRVLGPFDGKNFHFVHESAEVGNVVEATTRAAFDYCGQRGSSCESLYVPKSLWCEMVECLKSEIAALKVGDVCDFEAAVSAVISRQSYERIVEFLKHADGSENCKILCGGSYCSSLGYFIEPTLIECNSLEDVAMTQLVDGPVLSVFVYENKCSEDVIKHICNVKRKALAGAVFAADGQKASCIAQQMRNAVANMYINKPCIGATDGQSVELSQINEQNIASLECMLEHWVC